MQKTALIVDDSRSARIVLKRMLEAHSLNVDTAESAEAALDYLNDRRPDVIFMDHLMPGMDGFEAVTAIKKNPHTATIPIMMYTSQEGEVYVGQARALGAVGVLPKHVAPVEVSKVLASLRVIDAEPESAAPATHDGQRAPDTGADAEPPLDHEIRELLQDLFDQQRIILQREFRDSYRNLAARFAEELKRNDEPPRENVENDGTSFLERHSGILLVAVIALIFAALSWQREFTLRDLEQQNSELAGMLDRQAGETAGGSPGVPRLDDYRRSLEVAHASVLDALEWGVNRSGEYAFDEMPLGENRLQLFEELFERLVAMGFAGEVVVNVHVGDFCMLASGPDGFQVARDDLDAGRCDRIGFDSAEALSRGYRQSVAFANFVDVAEEQTGGAIRFDIVSYGNAAAQSEYPASAAGITAGEWNAIAARNNRVEIELRPDSE